jgi:hypothetical protein
MTTIILTIIGILLAAAAALMVVFYGGDAFNAGASGAAANTLQNAGTNVVSSVSMFKVENFGTNPANLAALTSNGRYLKETPTLPETDTGSAPVQTLAVVGNRALYSVTNVDRTVCTRINTNLKVTTVPTVIPTSQATIDIQAKMACALPVTGNGTFYAVS